MKNSKWYFTLMITCSFLFTNAQKTISEGTLIYTIAFDNGGKANGLSGAAETIYLKGGYSRIDMSSSLGSEKTIHDAKTGSAVILKEYSGQKLMITLTKQNWLERNQANDDITFNNEAEAKNILGYNCVKATAKLKDGSTMTVYYTKDVNVMNKDYKPVFKNLPGLPLQYEFEKNKIKFIYTATKIDLTAVPVSRFDFPKSGYRVMTYEESQSAKKDL